MKLADLKRGLDDRAKVNAWLDHIGEHGPACRNEILENCAKDPETRAYYVQRYETRGEHDKGNA